MSCICTVAVVGADRTGSGEYFAGGGTIGVSQWADTTKRKRGQPLMIAKVRWDFGGLNDWRFLTS